MTRVIDACEGELISYQTCYRQARILRDKVYCQQECLRARRITSIGSSSYSDPNRHSCADLCELVDNVNVPWYAECEEDGNHHCITWVFPNLDRLFTNISAMGIQRGGVIHVLQHPQLRKQETHTAIQTTETAEWQQETVRSITQKLYDDPAHTAYNHVRRADQPANTTINVPRSTFEVRSSVCEDQACEPDTSHTKTSNTPW